MENGKRTWKLDRDDSLSLYLSYIGIGANEGTERVWPGRNGGKIRDFVSSCLSLAGEKTGRKL